ncbi:MAG: sigma 54-interacting transcriptional regulator [Bacillota bacterium]
MDNQGLVFERQQEAPAGVFEPVISSPVTRAIFELALRVAPYPTTVLITGETGTGKEVLASYIHRQSPRAKHPFIKVNCGAIPESLLESELFGYERGAFTGARKEGAIGLFEAAHPGTLLLDEISELPIMAQAKLLRALQEREIRRVGGTWSRNVDVRVIVCTNQNLDELVNQGLFRSDLYYRLNVVHFHIPALRERMDEIELLCEHFCKLVNKAYGLYKRFSPEAIEKLKAYHWPGNIRELRNLVERMFVTSPREVIGPTDLPQRYLCPPAVRRETRTLKEIVADAERKAILEALSRSPDRQSAARSLGIDYSTLSRKMNRLGIR